MREFKYFQTKDIISHDNASNNPPRMPSGGVFSSTVKEIKMISPTLWISSQYAGSEILAEKSVAGLVPSQAALPVRCHESAHSGGRRIIPGALERSTPGGVIGFLVGMGSSAALGATDWREHGW
ncbi:hypothetical protein KCP70_14855 [Salmonella enterica subsp. enterica]|nr:hypothetical protein KCP70_14855 [Salmonella enterica subsp. enterica]